ncbi:GIY-YIG nuclease family protein [Haloferax profundi]|uniref:Endonuclease III n=1 Tax=Haloferax profundi TaxID=1544718 RepID=A0A0W1SW71_9EURY|nr:GIY-YIG nuclease family protein [Haloferax profundi]KTG30734.1 hypothetical protein AUR66_06435 [Haloferax profundi]
MTVYSLEPHALATAADPLELDTRAPRGTYALVFAVPETTIEVGALGDCEFDAGGYVYVGSAFGTGGLRRVLRHRRVASGDHDARHWHVDYLGGDSDVELTRVVCVPDQNVECAVSSTLGASALDGFGSSDCTCDAHLAAFENTETATSLAVATFESKV